jgi:RNA polymerase sporulation-specific sigma factor
LGFVTGSSVSGKIVLTDEQVKTLLRKAQSGDNTARNRLIEANYPLVISLIKRFITRGLERDDLFQVGCLGLMNAIDRFNLSFEVKFSTYAVPLILAEIHKYIRENRPVHITRHGLELARKAGEVRDTLYKELGRSPTPLEISERLGVAKEEVVAALDAVNTPYYLDEPLYEQENKVSRIEQIPASQQDFGEVIINSLALKKALEQLDEIERQIITWRFVQHRRQVEVAKDLGVSQAHISRMERRILNCIREYLQK